MKVLQLTLSFEPGGRRRAITTLAERLGHMGVMADLCCLDHLGCALEEVAPFFREVESLQRRSVFDARALKKLTRICDRRSTQIIHAHDAASQLVGAMIRIWRPRIRLLMTFHRSLGFESGRFRDRLRNAWSCARSGAVITGSRERRTHFLQNNFVRSYKVVRIPFGSDTERFAPNPEFREQVRREQGWSPETVVLGAVGHFGPEKGIDQVLLGFLYLCCRQLPNPPLLVIVGDGTPTQRAALRHLAEEIPPGRVFFAGRRPEIEKWFQSFDIFVHAPRLEAFGLVIIEAMAAGLPVVANAQSGVVDLVRDGSTGFLVPPGEPAKLAHALEQLIRKPELRKTMGEKARQTAVAEYGADLYAKRHLKLYEDLLAGRKPKGLDEPFSQANIPRSE